MQFSESRCTHHVMVRILPSAKRQMRIARGGASGDWRIICDCQRLARRERTLRRRCVRGVRFVVSHVKCRVAAFLVGIPVAFGAIGIPIEAMNITLPRISDPRDLIRPFQSPPSSASVNAFSIFTTRKVREAFLHPESGPRALTLDIVKEEFFRSRVPYGSIIYREAKRNNLAPEFVAAVVETESDFRPRLISDKNAQGLMQIVPETGRLLGAGDLFNPEQNVAAGTKYLRYLCDRFGDQRVALAAYNAGEGNIEKFGGVPPFPETITYLERVSESTSLYRQRVRSSYVASRRIRTFTH